MRKSALLAATLFAAVACSTAMAQDPNANTHKFLMDAGNPYVATGGKVPPAPPGMAAPAAPAKKTKKAK